MSALAWLFGLGFLALAGPFLFHLIRRTPKGEVRFSSLMFLRSSPPTLTRRSRLDNLLLMAIRMAAVALIATAFMRPFLNSNVKLEFADVPGKKTAVLLDTSASMKRVDLWDQTFLKLQQVIDDAEANDEIAVFTFDKQLKKQIDFTKKSDATTLLQKFKELKLEPTWNVSKLGDALVDVANRLLESQQSEQNSDTDDNHTLPSKLQIVLISDMQSGSSTAALQSFRWPENVKVEFETVATKRGTNATLELLPADESDPQQLRENVIVRNAKNSVSDEFSVSWENGSSASIPFQVPAGSSKILAVTRDSNSQSSSKLMLEGDDADFDNQFFAILPLKQTISIRYVGDESENDPEGMLYYLKRSLIETPTTTYNLQQSSSVADPMEFGLNFDTIDFLVVTRPLSGPENQAIDNLLERGVTLLVVLHDQSIIESTRDWTGVTTTEDTENSKSDSYAMLGNIDFSHPVITPFSGPRFNDFTQIRFWKFLRPNLPDNIQVLARFDDDTPAFWHQLAHDKSDLYTMGFGWQPENSQLALSSKFLPLMLRMIELSTKTGPVATNSIVGDTIESPKGYDRFISPDGDVKFIDDSSAQTLNSPGIYSFACSSDSELADLQIAVNLDPSESQTATMPIDQVSALGVEVGTHSTSDQEVEQQRQLLDFELENRQKLWKWLILGAIGMIMAESWLAGRTDRNNRSEESQ
jgi:uncharacterized protein YegL